MTNQYKSIDSNPGHNVEVLLKSIKDVKDKCLAT